MKKVTFMLIAALMAVVSYAQIPFSAELSQQRLADTNARPVMQARALTGKVVPTTAKRPAKAPAKIIKVTRDEILGSWMQTYVDYFDDVYASTEVTISAAEDDENGIIIAGWWGSWAKDLKAKLDPVNGTITIDRQLVYEYTGDQPADFVNVNDTTAAVVGNVVNGAIVFDAPWGAKVENTKSYYIIGVGTKLLRPNGVMTFTYSGSQRSAVVAIEQDPETKVATVWNFGDFGSGVDVQLNEDKSFLIESQKVYSTSNGDFYTYSLTASGGIGTPEITGTGTDTELTFGSNWTGYAETGYWLGARSATTIALTDGSTFEYPVIEEVAAVPATPSVTDFWHYSAELGYAQVAVEIPTQDVDGNAIKSALISYQLYAEVNGEQIAVGEPIAYTDETIAIDGTARIVKINDIAVKTYARMGVKSIYTAAGETNESAIGWMTIPSYIETAPEGLTYVELPFVGTRTLSNNGGTATYNGTVKFGRSGSDVYIQGLYSLVPEGWVKGTIADGKLTIPAGQYVGIRESNGSRIYTLAYTQGVGTGDITFTEKGYNWYVSDQMILESPYATLNQSYYQAYYAAGLTIGTEPPVAAGTYYIYNKEAEKFIAAGDAWGTRAILNTAGLDFGVALAEGKYTFDSNIANSASNHFLNGEFTDGASFAWTVEKVGDYFTISDGTKFLAAGENDLVMLVDEATDAAMWKFCTLEDRLAGLEVATAEAGVDATFLIPGANFGRNDKRVDSSWNVSADCTNKNLHGGANTNMCAESWHSTFTISQVLADAPAGKYQLTAQGFYRQDGEAEPAPVFFANDNTVEFPLLTGTENSMTDASASFTNGLYAIDPIEVTVAAKGALTVGVKGTSVTQWVIWDNFRLTYFGNKIDLSELVAAYQNALDAAQNALNDEANAVVTGEERTTLSDAIANNTGVDETSAEALTAAIEALTTATNAFNAAKGAYQALADTKAYVATLNFEYAAADKKAAAEEAAAAVATTAADATAKKEALLVAYRQFAESSALLEGVAGAVNMTDVIVNPAAEEAIAEPWTVVNGEGSNGSLGILDGEPWTDGEGNSTHKYFDGGNWGATSWDVALQQNITLPAGKYQLTVKSRASADLASFIVFAGEEKAEMFRMGASNGLFNRGWNDNSVVFELAEEATIAIGVQGVTTTQYNWMSFSDFRLVQFPVAEEPNENVIYSWESPEGTPKEYGGVISYENGTAESRLNYPNSGYYTICLNGKKANMNDETPSANAGYMLLTLDNAVSEGDEIAITGYITKNSSSKSSAYMVFETGATAETVFADEANIYEGMGGEITTKSVAVSEEAAGSKTIKMTRGQTGTNLFITKLVITKAESTVGITNVNANDFQNGAIYNLRGQRVEKATKGLYIINGKKVVLK